MPSISTTPIVVGGKSVTVKGGPWILGPTHSAVRISQIKAWSPSHNYSWDGSKWVAIP